MLFTASEVSGKLLNHGNIDSSLPKERSAPALRRVAETSVYHLIFGACVSICAILFVASFIPYYMARGREIEKCTDVVLHSGLCDDKLVSMLYGQAESKSAKVLSDIEIREMYYLGSSMNCESALLCAQEYQLWAAIRDWYQNGPIHVVMNASTWEMKVAYVVLACVFVWKMADGLKVTQILKQLTGKRRNVLELRKRDVALVPLHK